MTRLFTSFCALVIATGAFAQAGYRPAPKDADSGIAPGRGRSCSMNAGRRFRLA